MENFDQIFTLLASEGISLNTDILETGLINILALLGILIYTGRDFLGSLLEERRTTIVNGVQDAEDRLSEAQKRLAEAQKQLNQATIVISEIKNETVTTKKVLLESDAFQAKKDLTVRFDRALAAFRSKERQIFVEIKQQIISLVLQRTVSRVQETFKSKERQIFVEIKQQIISLVLQRTVSRVQETFKSQERSSALINETIDKLKGDLL